MTDIREWWYDALFYGAATWLALKLHSKFALAIVVFMFLVKVGIIPRLASDEEEKKS